MKNNEYKVEKKEVTVAILLDSQPPSREEVVLFLNPNSRFGIGPETVEEFLNHTHPFIPIRIRRTGTFSLMNLREIIWVHELEPTPPPPTRFMVRLFLAGDSVEDLNHSRILPPSQARLLDYLNGREQFIAFHKDGANIHVNKNKIIRSEENG